MSALASLPGALSAVISLANQAYLAVIAAIWYYAMHFGLTPQYSFPLGLGNKPSFTTFYDEIFGGVYVELVGVAILIGAFILLASNSMGRISAPSSFLYRVMFSVSLSFFSFQLCIFIMKFFRALFLQVWDLPDINWLSLFSVTNSVGQIRASFGQDPFFEVMEFLLLSSYFIGSGALLAILEIRQAILIFLILTLPIFSMFFMVKGLDGIAMKFWKLFLEINALPFFIVIIIYAVHLFPSNFLLQIALIFLAAATPYMLVTASNVLSSGASSMMQSGELFKSPLSNPVETLYGSVSQVTGTLGGGSSKGITGPVDASNGGVNMNSFSARDLEYRKYGGE